MFCLISDHQGTVSDFFGAHACRFNCPSTGGPVRSVLKFARASSKQCSTNGRLSSLSSNFHHCKTYEQGRSNGDELPSEHFFQYNMNTNGVRREWLRGLIPPPLIGRVPIPTHTSFYSVKKRLFLQI